MLTAGQKAVAGTAPVLLCVVPPGPGWVTVTSASGTAQLGFGLNLLSSNGVPIPAGGVLPFELFQGGGGGSLYAVGTATLGWIVSAASAQTGL